MDRFASTQVWIFQGSSWRAGVKRSIQMNSAAVNNVFLYTMIWHLLIMSCPIGCPCVFVKIHLLLPKSRTSTISSLVSSITTTFFGQKELHHIVTPLSQVHVVVYRVSLNTISVVCFHWLGILENIQVNYQSLIKKAVDAKKIFRSDLWFNTCAHQWQILFWWAHVFFIQGQKDCMFINLHWPFHINTDPLGDERFWRWWEAKVQDTVRWQVNPLALTQIKWISIYVETSSLKPDFYKFTSFQNRDQINLGRRWFEKKESEGARNCYFTWDKGRLW